jgi:hypothetical protein
MVRSFQAPGMVNQNGEHGEPAQASPPFAQSLNGGLGLLEVEC